MYSKIEEDRAWIIEVTDELDFCKGNLVVVRSTQFLGRN